MRTECVSEGHLRQSSICVARLQCPHRKIEKSLMMPLIHSPFLATHVVNCQCFDVKKIKPALKKVYHVHFGKDQPFSPTLLHVFGDDPAKQVRDAKETTKLSITIGSTSRFNDQYDKGSCRNFDQPHQEYGHGKKFNHFLEKGNKKKFKPYYKTNKEDK